MGKPSQGRQAKFAEKGENGKSKKYLKDAPLIHVIHPKVQKYIHKCPKIAPYSVIKINSIPI
jgi:hypothetical protein